MNTVNRGHAVFLAGIPGSPAAIWHSDGRGTRAVQSCRVQSEGVKNESKGLQETGLPANPDRDRLKRAPLLYNMEACLVGIKGEEVNGTVTNETASFWHVNHTPDLYDKSRKMPLVHGFCLSAM